MGQFWKLVNIDRMESPGSMGKLGEFLWGSHGYLVRRLCAPVNFPKAPRAGAKIAELGARDLSDHNAVSFDTILAIPELIIAIFECLDTYVDCLCFGLTNSEVWACGERIIQQEYIQYCAPWRGARLICAGDYARDVPAQLNNAQDLAQMAATFKHFIKRDAGGDPWDPHYFHQQILELSRDDAHTPHPTDLHNTASPPNIWFTELETDDARDEWQTHLEGLALSLYSSSTDPSDRPRAFSNYRRLSRHINRVGYRDSTTARDWEFLNAWMLETRTGSLPSGNDLVMVLRNLTKRQFVRSDTLSVTGNDPVWGFGRAIVSRICWSTDESVSMAWEGDIHRGAWAGDAFDIVHFSVFCAQIDEGSAAAEPEGWTDVTMEVREQLIAIWKSEFDDDWEDFAW